MRLHWLVETLFVALLFAGMFTVAACPPTPQPQPDGPLKPAADMRVADSCVLPDGGTLPVTADICEGRTHNHRACARCPSNHGCLDTVDYVWCITGSDCAKDPACTLDGAVRHAEGKR